MALTRPILYSQAAFDATEVHSFTFNVIGGDQVVSNRLIIVDQETNTEIYNELQTTYTFVHTLPANTLTNGNYYSATITTYNNFDEASTASAPIQFYCYLTPTFEISNIPSSGIINNSNYTFVLNYTQNEDEGLSSFIFKLYNASQIQIATSGTIYVATASYPYSYTFSGFNDTTNYFIQATGITAEGTELDTGLIGFYVNYLKPNVFSIVELNNNCHGGYITVNSNLINIEGTSQPSPPIYVDDDTAIDVRSSGNYVSWDSGYEINGDFTASLWGRDFNDNSRIITLEADNGNILKVNFRKEDTYYAYVDCEVISNGISYYIYSDSTPAPTAVDPVQIWLRRVGTLYEIKFEVLSREIPDAIAGIAIAGLSIVGTTTTS